MNHRLKTDPGPFEAVWQGAKRAEFRQDDRGGFHRGDLLTLIEHDRRSGENCGRWMGVEVTDVRRGGDYGIPDGYAMLSIRVRMRVDERPKEQGQERSIEHA